MNGMTMSTGNPNTAESALLEEHRKRNGEFGNRPLRKSEVGLFGNAPVIINSPISGDGRANLWIVVPEGQLVEMNVSETRIGRPEEQSWLEDTITFRRTDEGVRAVYAVTDDDINEIFATAFEDMTEDEADEVKMALRNEVRVKTFGNTDVFFQDGIVEFRHVSDHELDNDGGFFTANVFGDLESDPSYVLTRDGVLFPAAYNVLASYGYGENSEWAA